jgi:hypothetical protein
MKSWQMLLSLWSGLTTYFGERDAPMFTRFVAAGVRAALTKPLLTLLHIADTYPDRLLILLTTIGLLLSGALIIWMI